MAVCKLDIISLETYAEPAATTVVDGHWNLDFLSRYWSYLDAITTKVAGQCDLVVSFALRSLLITVVAVKVGVAEDGKLPVGVVVDIFAQCSCFNCLSAEAKYAHEVQAVAEQ